MKELSRRVMSNQDEGLACGPVSTYAVDAEIVVEDEGQKVYLHTQWVDEASDLIMFEATTESVYDYNIEIEKHVSDDDDTIFNDLIAKRDAVSRDKSVDCEIEERYADQYDELKKMMQEQLDKDGIEFDLNDPCGEDFEDEDDESNILEIRNNSFSAGPSGTEVAAVKFSLNGSRPQWLYYANTDGMPLFALTDDDHIDAVMSEDISDEDAEYIDERAIESLGSVDFGDTVEMAYRSAKESPDDPASEIVLALLRQFYSDDDFPDDDDE